MTLTPKQEKFVQGIISGLSQRDAYKEAYDTSKMKETTIDVKASELYKNGKVTARLQELQKEFTEKALYTREQAVQDLLWLKSETAIDIEENGINKFNANAFLGTVKQLTDLNGLNIEKVEIKGSMQLAQSELSELLEQRKKRSDNI